MNVLSLCSGIGGLDLGIRLAVPSARTVCFVEWEPYAACVLAERMAEGRLDACPIYCDDLRRFDAAQWSGCVDIVAAGFPCQPFSVAGKQRGTADERWLWPEVFRVIRESGASGCFLENVPPIVSSGGPRVLADLASLGWRAEWDMFRASDIGAPHRRERWFCLALADTDDARQRAGRWAVRHERHDARGCDSSLGDTNRETISVNSLGSVEVERDALDGWGDEKEHGTWRAGAHFFPQSYDTPCELWVGDEPAIRRGADGLPAGMGARALEALGNAVVPQQAALAFRILHERLMS